MRIKFLCIIICLFVNALVFASATNHTITGVVISGEDNEPLIGASVYVHADDLKKAGVSPLWVLSLILTVSFLFPFRKK